MGDSRDVQLFGDLSQLMAALLITRRRTPGAVLGIAIVVLHATAMLLVLTGNYTEEES